MQRKCGQQKVRSGWLSVTFLMMVCGLGPPAARGANPCIKLTLDGEVKAGREWNARIGQGWVFRVMPIAPAQAGYSGWDLVVDREPAAGFPDALLLATMPYGSLNEREIGTTFGLRAQDAIGWNPRSFHFLVDPAALKEGQKLFRSWMERGGAQAGKQPAGDDAVLKRLLAMQGGTGAGEFRIVDARIAAGIADPAPYAQVWAEASARSPHTVEQGRASALGSLEGLRFTLTLWLPQPWSAPPALHAEKAACPK